MSDVAIQALRDARAKLLEEIARIEQAIELLGAPAEATPKPPIHREPRGEEFIAALFEALGSETLTVDAMTERLDGVPRGTVGNYVLRLGEVGILEAVRKSRPRTYRRADMGISAADAFELAQAVRGERAARVAAERRDNGTAPESAAPTVGFARETVLRPSEGVTVGRRL